MLRINFCLVLWSLSITWCYSLPPVNQVREDIYFYDHNYQPIGLTTIEDEDSSEASATIRSDDLNSPISEELSSPRPFYNIAHMVNSIPEINYYLNKGANALEADITFAPNGTALYTFHGYPCDCFRHCTGSEDIVNYLKYLRTITVPESPSYRPEFTLMFFDLKLRNLPANAKSVAGRDMAIKMIDHLFQANKGDPYSKINVLMSIGYTDDAEFVTGFLKELDSQNLSFLSSRIGWDVGMNDPVSKILSMWKRLDLVNNIWQGDGRTNCVSPFLNLNRLTSILNARDNDSPIDKVYHWTIDLTASLRTSLRAGVDGIITNHPERIVNILKEPEFVNRVRRANISDSPWVRHDSKLSPLPLQVALPTQPSRWVSDLGDKANSITKYLKEFIYL